MDLFYTNQYRDKNGNMTTTIVPYAAADYLQKIDEINSTITIQMLIDAMLTPQGKQVLTDIETQKQALKAQAIILQLNIGG